MSWNHVQDIGAHDSRPCQVVEADWPYDCKARRRNPDDIVFVCQTHRVRWHRQRTGGLQAIPRPTLPKTTEECMESEVQSRKPYALVRTDDGWFLGLREIGDLLGPFLTEERAQRTMSSVDSRRTSPAPEWRQGNFKGGEK